MARAPRPLLLPRVALGGYPLGGGYGAIDESQARATVDAALDAGWTFIDTAETYVDSEDRLGRILEGRRDGVFLATKAFPCEPYTYKNLRAALEGSLRRLRTDRVDLYQLHGREAWVKPFDRRTPLEELAESLERLQDSGKALQVGVCNYSVAELDVLRSRTGLFSTQNLWSILDRGHDPDDLHLPVESEILPYAAEHGIAFLAYSPFSRGILVDRLDPARRFPPEDERHYLPRFQPGVYEHYVTLAARLAEWARDHGRTLAQLAVAWTLQHPAVTSTLVGVKSPEHVESLAGVDEWLLSDSELAEIDGIVDALPLAARRERYAVWEHFPMEALERLKQRRYLASSSSAAVFVE